MSKEKRYATWEEVEKTAAAMHKRLAAQPSSEVYVHPADDRKPPTPEFTSIKKEV